MDLLQPAHLYDVSERRVDIVARFVSQILLLGWTSWVHINHLLHTPQGDILVPGLVCLEEIVKFIRILCCVSIGYYVISLGGIPVGIVSHPSAQQAVVIWQHWNSKSKGCDGGVRDFLEAHDDFQIPNIAIYPLEVEHTHTIRIWIFSSCISSLLKYLEYPRTWWRCGSCFVSDKHPAVVKQRGDGKIPKIDQTPKEEIGCKTPTGTQRKRHSPVISGNKKIECMNYWCKLDNYCPCRVTN